MCKILNIYYQIPIPVSALTPVKLKTVSKVTKKEEPLNVNLAEPNEMKALHYILVCVNQNFKNQLLIDVQLIKKLS